MTATHRFLPVVLLVAACLAAPLPGAAQPEPAPGQTLEQYAKVLRWDLIARRNSALQALIHLNAEQGKKFQALKNDYDARLKKLADQRISLMEEFGKVHDKLGADQARDLANRFFKIEDDRNALRRETFERMSAQISPVVAVQFMQLQRQFETMADLKAATLVPLAIQ
jgi:hypothetical protein